MGVQTNVIIVLDNEKYKSRGTETSSAQEGMPAIIRHQKKKLSSLVMASGTALSSINC